MIEITAEIRALIDKAAAGVELAGDEYIDPADGLIHCKKCGGQRQTVVPCFGKPGYFMPRCICQCQQEAEEQRKAAEERQRRMERIKRRKAQGLQDRYLYDYTFANDNGQNPLMDKARAYVENWKEAYKSNIGLLLFGDVGTGKSFFAGCIANALLDRDVPVLMTNFPTILNRLTGMFSEDRADFIASFDEYDLLIIDDLGVERSTEYAMEQKALYKDNCDTIIGNCDSSVFLGGKEPTTLKELSAALGKETIDTFNTGESRGREVSHSLNYQKLGKELMSQDELAVMNGGKCILQLRGVRPFLSDKYDITKHPNYKYLSDANPKNAFDIEKFLSTKLKLKPEEEFEVFDTGAAAGSESA